VIAHVLRGYAAVHRPDGSVEWRSELLENTLMNQGEMDVLDVYLREQAHKTKYLGMFNQPSGNDPLDTDTIASVSANESSTPGTNGYTRQQVLAADWGVSTLYGEDYRTTLSAAKVFGPFTASAPNVSHILLVTTAAGVTSPATLALAWIALGTVATVPIGQTFSFTPIAGAF
jgi:hypothetical protein